MYKFYVVYVHSDEEHDTYKWLFAHAEKPEVDEEVLADFYEQVGLPPYGSNVIITWEYIGVWDNRNDLSSPLSEEKVKLRV